MKKILYLSLLIIMIGCNRHPSRLVSSEPSGPFGSISDTAITKRPFQVIYAKQAHGFGDTINLASFELLAVNDTIQLDDSGYLIMAHYSGLFLAFENDTTFLLSDISNSIVQCLNINPNEVKFRTNLELLYSKEQVYQYSLGATMHTSPPIEFIFPTKMTMKLSANNPRLCVLWTANNLNISDTFNIRIENIFGDSLDIIEIKGNKLDLDLSEYYEQKYFVINIESKNGRERSQESGIFLGEQYFYAPSNCKLNSAVKALEMGYHLEINHHYLDATEYYELAAKLSDYKIFDKLLNNHVNRK